MLTKKAVHEKAYGKAFSTYTHTPFIYTNILWRKWDNHTETMQAEIISENFTTIFSTRLGFSFSGFSDMKVDRSSGCQACKSCISMLFIQQQQIHIISQMVSFNLTKCAKHTDSAMYYLFLVKINPNKLPLIHFSSICSE